jgi:hypothetical protein
MPHAITPLPPQPDPPTVLLITHPITPAAAPARPADGAARHHTHRRSWSAWPKWSDQIASMRHKFSPILAKRLSDPQVIDQSFAVNNLCNVSQALPEWHPSDTRSRYPEVPGSPNPG